MKHKKSKIGIDKIDNMYSYVNNYGLQWKPKDSIHQYNIYETDQFFNYMIIISDKDQTSFYDI